MKTYTSKIKYLFLFAVIFFSFIIGVGSMVAAADNDVDQVYAYPTPFKSGSGHKTITFTNLPTSGTLKIYNTSGELVRKIDINISSGQSTYSWDVKNEDGEDVASDIYLYFISSGSNTKTGKLMVVR